MMSNDIEVAIPAYSILSLEGCNVNPYREFSFYCKNTIYPNLSKYYNLSLKDLYAMTNKERINFVNSLNEIMPNAKFTIDEKPPHEKIFLKFDVSIENRNIASVIFYTHYSYSSSLSVTSNPNFNYDDLESFVACELDFTMFDELSFLQIPKENNIFDYTKSDENSLTVDMIIANLCGLCNFIDFIKILKTKILTVKNINMFTEKLIKPYVSDLTILFSPDSFIIGVICNNNIYKKEYSYNNYLTSINKFSEFIKNLKIDNAVNS